MKFGVLAQNLTFFYVVTWKKKLVVMNGVKIANVFYGTHMGHTQLGCGHNFDAQKIFLFLRFL